MKRLDWSNFRWDQGVIEIKGGKAKIMLRARWIVLGCESAPPRQ